jgi:polysaccharide deacetylase family protein (PEP-CTERM system associated)
MIKSKFNLKWQPIFSIDVEDWVQSAWNNNSKITDVAQTNVLSLLERLERLDIKVTMFVLGKFAETFPDVVKKISNLGHEVAAHGHGHLSILTQSKEHFRKDIRRNKDYLEQLIGKEVIGYRAPYFSITQKTIWAIEELIDAGFLYDSSIFPIKGKRYGISNFCLHPHLIKLKNNKSIIEFPLTAYSVGKRNYPISGGGYFRLLPSFVVHILMKKILTERPFVSYVHPYEFNKDEFKDMEVSIPFLFKIHQGLFRSRFGKRFDSYVKEFGGTTFSNFIKENKFDTMELHPNLTRMNIYQ